MTSPELAIFIPSLGVGGAERVLVTLLNEFQRDDIELVVANKVGKLSNELPKDLSIVDLKAPDTPGFSLVGSVPYLIRYLNTKRPENVLSFMTHANIVSLISSCLATHHPNIIISEHNELGASLQRSSRFRRGVVTSAIRRLYPNSDRVIAVSQGVADELHRGFGVNKQKLNVVHNPIPVDKIREDSKETPDHRWLTDYDLDVVLGVGSLHPQKDFLTLISSFAEMDEKADKRLMIIGEGPQEAKIERKISKEGLEEYVEIISYVENIYSHMGSADVFALSSAWEGFGNVIVESLASGTPVVATDCSGPRDIMNSQTGELVPVGDSKSMSDAIQKLLISPPPEKELRNYCSRFQSDNIAEEYLRVCLSN